MFVVVCSLLFVGRVCCSCRVRFVVVCGSLCSLVVVCCRSVLFLLVVVVRWWCLLLSLVVCDLMFFLVGFV